MLADHTFRSQSWANEYEERSEAEFKCKVLHFNSIFCCSCVCVTISYIKSAACLSKLTITNKPTLETEERKGVCVFGGGLPYVSALSRPHGGFQKLNERLLQLRYSVRTAKKD